MSLSAIFDPIVRAIFESKAKANEAGFISGGNLSGEYYNDTPMEDLKPHAFARNIELEKVDLPNATREVGELCFEACIKLKSVNLPKVTKIDSRVFKACLALTVLDFPSVYRINQVSFARAEGLKALVLRYGDIVDIKWSDDSEFEAVDFSDTPIATGNGYIYVPRELVDVYKTNTDYEFWNYWASQIRAIEDYTVDGTITGELDLTKMGL